MSAHLHVPDLSQHLDAERQVLLGVAGEGQTLVDPSLAEVAVHRIALETENTAIMALY